MSAVAKTPREELECKKKYLYEHSMFWECNNGSKCQILEEDVCDLLNDQAETIRKQSIRIYCQGKEIQRLLGELEKIPKSIREVWLEE